MAAGLGRRQGGVGYRNVARSRGPMEGGVAHEAQRNRSPCDDRKLHPAYREDLDQRGGSDCDRDRMCVELPVEDAKEAYCAKPRKWLYGMRRAAREMGNGVITHQRWWASVSPRQGWAHSVPPLNA